MAAITIRQGPSGPKLRSGEAGFVVTSVGGDKFESLPPVVDALSNNVPVAAGLALGAPGVTVSARRGDNVPELPWYRWQTYTQLASVFPPDGAGLIALPSSVHRLAGMIQLPDGVRIAGADASSFVDLQIERVGFGLTGNVDGASAMLDLPRGPQLSGPMTVINAGSAPALRVSTSAEFRLLNWTVVGTFQVETQTTLIGGNYELISFAAGDRLRIGDALLRQVVLASLAGDSARGVWLSNCVQNGSTGNFVDCPDGQTLLHGVFLSNCEADGQLVRLGLNINNGPNVGATMPFVGVQNCRCNAAAGGVEIRNGTVFPAGGLSVVGNHFVAAAPFGLADPQDALFYSRANFGAGAKLTETTLVP